MPNPVIHRASDQEIASSADEPATAAWRVAWLTLRVHADAFLYDPAGYLQAVAWRARGLKLRSRNRIAALAGRSPHAYDLWIARDEPKARFGQPLPLWLPKIVPVVDCRKAWDGLDRTLASLGDGIERCVLIGGPEAAGVHIVDRPKDLAAYAEPGGTWLCPLFAGDTLANGALTAYAAAASDAGDSSVIYADDDALDPNGRRTTPHFKPNWNPDLFEHHDFIAASAIVRATPKDLAGLPDEEWIERLVELELKRGRDPVHLPLVLHHRRLRPDPVVPAKPVLGSAVGPPVSLIIPTRNQVRFLRACVEGARQTDYPGIETIVIDNGSDDAETIAYLGTLENDGVVILRQPGPFNFSALNNAAVTHARGEMLCFLNNDVEVLDRDWLALMVRQAMRPEIGAVGARLLYPDGTVQHAGVCTGIGGGAAHVHRFQGADDAGYFERARLPQRVTAVTAACLVVTKEKFLAVGGFDEQDFPVAFNDVDLCLKLNAKGWQSFYEPRATLIHHESKSRGSDAAKGNRARFAGELAALKRKWGTDVQRDPYHHPQLSPFCEQFFVAV